MSALLSGEALQSLETRVRERLNSDPALRSGLIDRELALAILESPDIATEDRKSVV